MNDIGFNQMFPEDPDGRPPVDTAVVYPRFFREGGSWKVQEDANDEVRECTETEAYLCREVELWRRPMSKSIMREECQRCGDNYVTTIEDLKMKLANAMTKQVLKEDPLDS